VLSQLIALSLRHRFAVLALTAAMAALGVWSLRDLPIDAFPDTTPVQVQVNTVAPALGPEEIERLVTFPVEQSLSGLPGLVEVRSLSRFGLSQVTALFEDGTDLYRARQVVGERIAAARLPEHLGPPVLGPAATGLGEVFHYLVTGRGKSLAELRTVHDWVLRPQLRSVRGVAEVNAWGGEERRVEVRVDPVELRRRGLALHDVAGALRRSHGSEGGGRLVQSGEGTLVQGVALLTSLADVEGVVIGAEGGVPIRVRDVARVVEGAEVRRGAVTAHGRGEAVLGLGFMLLGENSREVSAALRARLDDARRSLPPGIDVEVVYDRRTLVDEVLTTVRANLLEGALLVVLVLFVFLGNVRAGLVVASVIPLAMLFAFTAMRLTNVAGSLMSLGAIDFGLVVDSAIIAVENATRRLREDGGRRPVVDVVREASLEVRGPTLFGELVIAIVYLPVLAMAGLEGKLFRPMALTVLFALAASMALSLTYVPVMTSLVFRRGARGDEPRLVAWLQRRYRPVVEMALRRRAWVLVLAALLVANGALLATRLGAEFVPRLSEGTVVVNTVRLASVDLDESVRYGTQIERALLAAFPSEIQRIWTRTGTAEVATDPMGVELSDVFVTLKPRAGWRRARSQDELVRAMQAELQDLPGMRTVFTQPIEMRVNEMVAGVRADLGIKIFGDDLDELRAAARRVDAIVRTIPGSADVSVEQVTGLPVLRVELDQAAASRFGIPADRVLATVAALAGVEVAELREGQRRFPVALRIEPARAVDADAVGALLVAAPDGTQVALSRLARLRTEAGPSTIQREWARRRIIVQTNVRGRDIASFVAEARRRIAAEARLAPGYSVAYGGQFEHLERARHRLFFVVPLALLLVFSLLYLTYGRVLDALRVFTGVPFAAVGGVAALWLRGMPFSISAAVGFIAVSGVAVLGDMVLASTIRRALDAGVAPAEAIRAAALERLRPVLMTALVAGLGFLPMALSRGVGAEVQRPLATVVLGGLLSSTLLTLVVLPALYSFLAQPRAGASEGPGEAPHVG
jgi:cobalt-zinc-cadmium resistance protein CzcA